MSTTSALERIERWARQNDPAFVALLQPGLTQQEINAAVGDLPFALAEEVYELYQWRNGQKEGQFRLGLVRSVLYPFMPLEEALNEYTQFQAEDYKQSVLEAYGEFDGSGGWLPLMGMERYYKASLGTAAGSQKSHILGLTRDDFPHVSYGSLTSMLEFQADVYESGALRVDEEGHDFFDYLTASVIKREHFPAKTAQAGEVYRQECCLPGGRAAGTPDRPTPEEYAQYGLVNHLVQTGSLQAVPATEQYLRWLLEDAEQAKQITQALVKSPNTVMYEWPHERSLLVHNLSYSYNL